jgi:thiamine biosynthesis lipoprotein
MDAPPTAVRRVAECMGTVFSIDVRSAGVAVSALDDILDWLHWVDETFSTYRRNSQVSRLSRGEVTMAECAPEVFEIMQLCERFELETDGLFSAHSSGTLDPSGAVKGWAIERASDLLSQAGSNSHCVNGGGDVQCVGDNGAGQPWRIGVANPHRAGEIAAVVLGRDLAVATSGTAERGGHVIDPRSGQPASELASITLVGRRLTEVDAFATAAFALGDAAREWVENLPGIEAFAVAPDGSTWFTTGFAGDITT